MDGGEAGADTTQIFLGLFRALSCDRCGQNVDHSKEHEPRCGGLINVRIFGETKPNREVARFIERRADFGERDSLCAILARDIGAIDIGLRQAGCRNEYHHITLAQGGGMHALKVCVGDGD